MVQLVVSFNSTHVFTVESHPTVREVKSLLQGAEGIPAEFISVTLDGAIGNNEDIIADEVQLVRASLSSGLCGGKGGFGAQLRALAKQKAYRKTLDFGACRDLNGRRLRHVNDEVLLQKWKEAKDKNEEFEIEGQTATGIDLWYLSVPNWAEGVKVDKRKLFMKPRMKTQLCIDWKRARERRPAPDGAPAHWGCPRGRRCEFAHGVEELRGEAQTALLNAEQEKKREEQHRKRDEYMGVLYRANKQEEELEDLVMAGLRAAKKAKLAAQGAPAAEVDATGADVANDKVASDETAVAAGTDSGDDSDEQQQTDYLCVVAGTVVVAKETVPKGRQPAAVCPVVTGTSAFATVAVDKCSLTAGSAKTWYYEVELQSDGLMQIGWCSSAFLASADLQKTETSASAAVAAAAEAVGVSEEKGVAVSADGVGDDANSWAFDGYRQLKWHNGESAAYGPQTGVIWKAGDVVGCKLTLHAAKTSAVTGKSAAKKRKQSEQASGEQVPPSRATISYTLNGEDYGVAFEFDVNPTISGSEEHFFPAISLENEEAALINLGSRHFAHRPAAGSSSSSSAASKAGEVTAVWASVTGLLEGVEDVTTGVIDDAAAAVPGEKETSAMTVAPPAAPQPSPPVDYPAIDLESEQYATAEALEGLGLAHLKQELERRGLKAGGTLQERALRLFSVRGLRPDQVDPKLLAKKK